MSKVILDADEILQHATPKAHQEGHEIQPWGHLIRMPIALAESTCKESVENLNQLLADTMTLRDLYKKHHWQVSGPTFYQLHLLFDKHYAEQSKLIDVIAERIQLFLEYTPQPPFTSGSPDTAPKEVLAKVSETIAPMLTRRKEATLRAAQRLKAPAS